MSAQRITPPPLECIAAWHQALKERGFDERIKIEQWFDEWKDRRHAAVMGSDGSLLEITYANAYVRVVADPHAPSDRPFAFYRYVSERYPERPKEEFYADKGPARYLTRQEVSAQLAAYLL